MAAVLLQSSVLGSSQQSSLLKISHLNLNRATTTFFYIPQISHSLNISLASRVTRPSLVTRASTSESSPEDIPKKDKIISAKKGMSMSQKLTVGYAALVGVGVLMGYMKKGSIKSLLSRLASAGVLVHVYNELHITPIFASFLGFGVSLTFLIMMGFRFKATGKVFPAGIVSVASLIMVVGYIHGMVRSKKAT